MIHAIGRLRVIKAAHTLAWAFFVGCILAVPLLALARRFHLALLLIAIVSIEVVVIALNGWRCPLTAVAARYTDDRRPNVDIYLPEWLARYDEEGCSTLIGAGIQLTMILWIER